MFFKIGAKVVARMCSVKNVLLKISQNSLENNYARVSFLIKQAANFIKIETLAQACNFIKKEALAQVFPLNFAKFLKAGLYDEIFLSQVVNFLLL